MSENDAAWYGFLGGPVAWTHRGSIALHQPPQHDVLAEVADLPAAALHADLLLPPVRPLDKGSERGSDRGSERGQIGGQRGVR